jgi:hypothetical protein
MSDDMRRFRPNLGKILRDTTPEKVAERVHKALQNVDPTDLARRSAPAPVLPAEERPVTKPARPAARRRWPATWIVVLGCVGVMLTAMLAAVLVMTARAKEAADKAAARMSPAATAPAVTTAPTATAAPVQPTATAVPTTTTGASPVMSGTPSIAPPPRKLPAKRQAPQEPQKNDTAPPPSIAPPSPPPPTFFE